MSALLFEEVARFKGCPPICNATNLPAFKTEADLKKFAFINGPRVTMDWIWLCKTCGHYHARTGAPNPSGDSSGTGRSRK